ncbi:Protein glass [Fasciolopsis buskii]|uniref:Protein glass n=1 Tax=Fasciolopsis buskii TaxID=27845 RepID=A0A8E0VGB7_9TREM|nr:Protein glass [Fasciolopsis buski]
MIQNCNVYSNTDPWEPVPYEQDKAYRNWTYSSGGFREHLNSDAELTGKFSVDCGTVPSGLGMNEASCCCWNTSNKCYLGQASCDRSELPTCGTGANSQLNSRCDSSCITPSFHLSLSMCMHVNLNSEEIDEDLERMNNRKTVYNEFSSNKTLENLTVPISDIPMNSSISPTDYYPCGMTYYQDKIPGCCLKSCQCTCIGHCAEHPVNEVETELSSQYFFNCTRMDSTQNSEHFQLPSQLENNDDESCCLCQLTALARPVDEAPTSLTKLITEPEMSNLGCNFPSVNALHSVGSEIPKVPCDLPRQRTIYSTEYQSSRLEPIQYNAEQSFGITDTHRVLSLDHPMCANEIHTKTCVANKQSSVCFLCARVYARPSTLKTHLRTHSGLRPYQCVGCGKKFSQVANLTAHMRTHSGDRPFQCPVCHRSFSQSSSVTTHMRTHSGERPYKCHMCSKAFADSSTLTKHIRVHSGEKPYRCDQCCVRFSQSGNLKRHSRIHLKSDSKH